MFNFFGNGGSIAFKSKVKAINDNESLSDTEKMEEIDLLLNPPQPTYFEITFSDGEVITFSDNKTIEYEVE